MQIWKLKGNISIIFGILFLIVWGLGIIIALAYFFGWYKLDPGAGISIFSFCTVVGFIPGVALLALGLKAKREEKDLITIVGYLKTYRRMKLSNLAEKLGKREFEVESLILKCIDKKLLTGFIDRTTNEFVVPEAVSRELTVTKCPNCSAPVSEEHLRGETIRCKYCGMLITKHD